MDGRMGSVQRLGCWSGLVWALVSALFLSSCASSVKIPLTVAPVAGNGYPEKLTLEEPGAQEVVVVINYNMKVQHAGMFAGPTLLDPAGSYLNVRSRRDGWPGVSLQDYVRFQLEDGPDIRLYRFFLSASQFVQIKARVDEAGTTPPLFCAAKVQNILSGVAPFESLPDAWLVSPARLAEYLDDVIVTNTGSGECRWPNGASCYVRPPDASAVTAAQ
jgi:hypothetical protein